MVKCSSDTLDRTFAALADPTRRAILARLTLGEASVGQLAEPFEISLPAISRHLKALETAGLIARHRDGRVHRCQLDPAPLKRAQEWIEHYQEFWEDQFDKLSRYLDETAKEEETDGGSESTDNDSS